MSKMNPRRLVTVSALVLAVVGAACSDGSVPELEGPSERVAQAASGSTPPGLRWVGVGNPDAPCPPAAAGFEVSRLVGADAPASLRKYCVYEWMGDPANVGPLPPKGSTPGAAWLDREYAVVAATSPASKAEELVAPVLTAAHRAQIESPSTGVVGVTPVTVSIIDTWPSTTERGRSAHGVGMAGIVERVACDAITSPGACPVRTVPRLALDRYGRNAVRDRVGGGTYGYPSAITSALYAAVAAPGPGRKIVNLSFAWDRKYDASTSTPGALAHGSESVIEALRQAACANVLVIAAAGNATGGPVPAVGAMSPARWETMAAPAGCGGGPARPLLYSVAGVDGHDDPLPNARPGARAALVAPSFVVPSAKTIGGVLERTGPFTGSSVSAAVVSAAAAVVWHVNGGLTPAAVMNRITTGAQPLSATADYCFAAPCGNVRRVSLCRALGLAGAAVTCTPILAGAGKNPSYTTATLAAVRAAVDHTATSKALSKKAVAGCSLPIFSSRAPAETREACPSEVLSNDLVNPSVDPQPGSDPCPACMLQLDPWNIYIEMPVIDELPLGAQIVPQTLDLTIDGEVVEQYDLGNAIDSDTSAPLRDGLAPGSLHHVVLPLPPAYLSGYTGARINWTAPATFKASAALLSP